MSQGQSSDRLAKHVLKLPAEGKSVWFARVICARIMTQVLIVSLATGFGVPCYNSVQVRADSFVTLLASVANRVGELIIELSSLRKYASVCIARKFTTILKFELKGLAVRSTWK